MDYNVLGSILWLPSLGNSHVGFWARVDGALEGGKAHLITTEGHKCELQTRAHATWMGCKVAS